MENTKNIVYLPKSINRKITFMLYNYKQMNKLIESRKEELIDKIKVTNVAYLKAINKSNNTLEDMIIRFDEDKTINKYKQWQKLINSFTNHLYNNDKLIDYYIIKYKYFDGLTEEFICEHLNITKEELKFEDMKIKHLIWLQAIKIGLLKGGGLNYVRM